MSIPGNGQGLLSGETFVAQDYSHFDELGSTRILTDGDGTVTDTYTYDAWGKQTAHTGSTAQPYRYVGCLGYYSHYQDTNLFSESSYQFLQLGVRFYDALSARFTQRDPVETLNSYSYVVGSPFTLRDPTGLSPWSDALKDALNLLLDWITGSGGAYRVYGPGTAQVAQMQQSQGVKNAQAQAAATCKNGTYQWKTPDAFFEPLRIGFLYATISQVGAYRVEWEFNCPKGTVRYRVSNTLSIKSFFYHLPFLPKKPARTGPMAEIRQKFWWDEAAPVGCCSSKKPCP